MKTVYYNSNYGTISNFNTNSIRNVVFGGTDVPNSFMSGETKITSISLGSNVKTIGYDAFNGCKGISSITIPDSITDIYSGAFSDCGKIDVYITSLNNWYEINFGHVDSNPMHSAGGDLYLNGVPITTLTLPDTMTSIGYRFCGCTSLVSVTLSDSITKVGEAAFEYCANLKTVTIPDSVTSLESWAFKYCTSLESINLPDSVTSIGGYAFYNCTSLSSLTIPDSVTSIGGYAFYNCTSLNSFTIPDSVTSIGEWTLDVRVLPVYRYLTA